jgi:hypothetical protein
MLVTIQIYRDYCQVYNKSGQLFVGSSIMKPQMKHKECNLGKVACHAGNIQRRTGYVTNDGYLFLCILCRVPVGSLVAAC